MGIAAHRPKCHPAKKDIICHMLWFGLIWCWFDFIFVIYPRKSILYNKYAQWWSRTSFYKQRMWSTIIEYMVCMSIAINLDDNNCIIPSIYSYIFIITMSLYVFSIQRRTVCVWFTILLACFWSKLTYLSMLFILELAFTVGTVTYKMCLHLLLWSWNWAYLKWLCTPKTMVALL